jgi:hypothetical protein
MGMSPAKICKNMNVSSDVSKHSVQKMLSFDRQVAGVAFQKMVDYVLGWAV